MSDALAEVRKSKVTHADTTQVTRPNSKVLTNDVFAEH